MNGNQKNFLKELYELMKKYSIDEMKGIDEDMHDDMCIIFKSNGCHLIVREYYKGKFSEISTYEPEYVIKE